MLKYLSSLILIITLLTACNKPKTLPIYGKEAIKTESGYDTIIKPVPAFEFIDQKGTIVTNETFKDKIFIVDFFFTSCPSICPVMTKNMLKIHDAYIDNDKIKLLSHTIDPKRDSVQRLDVYANKIDINTNEKWHFVTAEKEKISKMAESYMIVAYEDDEVPGGFEHSGYFILVDAQQRIRGYYDGTLDEDTEELIADLQILLNE